jgi:hypothetical protein
MKRANGKKSTLIKRHTDLKVYKAAFDLCMGTNPQKWLLPK